MSVTTGRPAFSDPPPAANRAVLGFAFRFVVGWAVVIVVVSWFPGLDRWAVDHTVASLLAAARLFHVAGTTSGGASIQLVGTALQIVPDCTPLMPFAALTIAVFAFPATWRWRALGLAGGALALWLYNLLRIFVLASVLRFRPDWFEFIHIYLWQTMTLLVVFAMFLVWLRLQNRGAAPVRAASPDAAPRPPAP